jgi:hypothetical protein
MTTFCAHSQEEPVRYLARTRDCATPTCDGGFEWVKPTRADVDALRLVDPTRAERWTPFLDQAVNGWCFEIVGSYDNYSYKFFCCRRRCEASYRVVLLEPIAEVRAFQRRVRAPIGHHLAIDHFDGEPVVVIDPPGGTVVPDILAARQTAILWVCYMSAYRGEPDRRCRL